uniref:Mitochondrial intermembrane space import and assembly protein 40-A-like n=1 Tax=Salarias fasciatus TaxID=181472 RepID=A0A672F9Y3_SALFA
MSFDVTEGKDRTIFVTKEDQEAPSNAELVADDPDDPYEEQGLILPSGDMNWNCPCLGGVASGPCGSQFKEAFSCFHYSKEEVKGSDCIENVCNLQECEQKNPELYPQEEDEDVATQQESDSALTSAAPPDTSALSPESEPSPTPSAVTPDSSSATDGQTAS